MKRLFNHKNNSHEEWENCDVHTYDCDVPENREGEKSETYIDEDSIYCVEEPEECYSEETGEYCEESVEEYCVEEPSGYYAEEKGEYYEESVEEYRLEEPNGYYTEEMGEYYDEEPIEYSEGSVEEYNPEESEEYYIEEAAENYAEILEEYHAEEVAEYYSEEAAENYAESIEEYHTENLEVYDIEEASANYEENIEEYSAEELAEYHAEETGAYYEETENQTHYTEEALNTNETYTLWYDEKKAKKSARKANSSKKNFFAFLWTNFLEMKAMDRVVTAAGVAILTVALVTGSLYVSNKVMGEPVSEFAQVGNQLEGIELIGEKGLLAIADAEAAKQVAAELLAEEEAAREEQKEYDEKEYVNTVDVKLSMTSVKQDLKIKFINEESRKLIANIPLSVTITNPDGQSETWFDDDMDGIIYKKGIEGGTYTVLVNELAGEEYAGYTIPSTAQTVEVKEEIAYEKVDVSDEVVNEAEIDVSKEDTKINETVVESTLEDTVTFVESTAVSETYTEVSKSMIPDPATLVLTTSEVIPLMETSNVYSVSSGDAGTGYTASISPATASVVVGDTLSAKVTASGYTEGSSLKYSVMSNNTEVATATVDENGNITVSGVGVGTTTITATVNYAEGESTPATATLQLTVLDKAIIALDKTEATVYLSESVTMNASITNDFTDTPVTAESSDSTIATVSVDGKAITITGVAEGDVTITVKYVVDNEEIQAACTVKVRPQPKDNKTDALKDMNGNQLYVLENEKYREAVYADYYTASNFFVKGDIKYTGWQTIDGSLYYFTATGEKVTGEQIIQGAKYNFASDGSLITGFSSLGIDVSKWNGKIDWNAVKNSGVSYVIIRCGYRGSSTGKLVEDPTFQENIQGAIDAGLKVGVYFFTQAVDEVEAVEEASFVLDRIQNYKISYPVFLDVEPSSGRGDEIDADTRTAVCKAFCETIQRSGYTAGIYANRTWLNGKMNIDELGAYKIWLAQYAATPTYTGRYDLWQYTATGKVSGISGDVDLNLSYMGY